MKHFLLSCLGLFLSFGLQAQGVTTGSIAGRVTDAEGVEAIGATVLITHEPSGSKYNTATRGDGTYFFPNVRVGGPYTVAVTYIGYEEQTILNQYVSLGQTTEINVKLREGVDLESIEITAADYLRKMGSESKVSERDLANLPTVNRDLNDYLRLNPLANVRQEDPGTSISIAGMNNRFNAIFIDGAVNNDVFGLSASGTNGGQTGVSPISLDAIEQLQISVSPYDVKLGGFAGAGINAVTRSGSNNLEGSAYYFFRNQNLTGKTPTFNLPDSVARTRVADYTAQTFGFRLGGPIIKDKLFFFVNTELQRDRTPQPFDLSNYAGQLNANDLQTLRSHLQERYGYDAGNYDDAANVLRGNRILGKLDWNLDDKHKLSLRHSYTRAESIRPFVSGPQALYFGNTAVYFPSTTNSTALEWNSLYGNRFSNNFILGFTAVRDNRGPSGDPFPWVRINDGTGSIFLGSEEFSTANELRQNVFTLTNNFNIYAGKHSLTLGTHNEFYSMYNLFIRQNFGSYRFNSLADFLAADSVRPIDYNYSYAVNGDGAANFNALQLGFYVQDEYRASRRLTLTAGLRFDVPMFLTQPAEDTFFNNRVRPAVDSAWDLQGARAGQMPKAQVYVSPRLGFNFDVFGDRKSTLRGGVGLFTSRAPFVWPAGAYTNNGLTVGGIRADGAGGRPQSPLFNPDPNAQPRAEDLGATTRIPSGEMNLVTPNFRYPQVLRTSLAWDQKLPWGLDLSVEGIFTQTLNNVFYQNVNLRPSTTNLSGTPDERPVYTGFINNTYSAIYLLSNTNKGYTYNFSSQLTKSFDKGFSGMVAYSFGRAYSIFEGTSSQNSSQWRGQHSVQGRNFADIARSEFDMGSRVTTALSYEITYPATEQLFGKTTISIFYNGQSGLPFSYIYADNVRVGNTQYLAINGEDSRERSLIYVPANASEIRLIDRPNRTAQQQWEELNAFIEADPYLSGRRGQYAQRNMNRTPFTHGFDLRILQDVTFKQANGKKNTLQFSLDLMNLGNFLYKNWGRVYRAPNFGNYALLRFEGYDPTAPTGVRIPQYSFNEQTLDPWPINDFLSRWRMQLGVRYLFQ